VIQPSVAEVNAAGNLVLERYKSQINEALSAQAHSPPDLPLEAIQAMEYSINVGGKRIRPTIVMLACESIGGKPAKGLTAAVAAELLHIATLLYDDVIDDDHIRRGQPALHVKFGKEVAVIIAGLMTTRAFWYLKHDPRLVRLVLNAMNELGAGAVLELKREIRDVDGYLEVAQKKTAALFQLAGTVGAVAGNGTKAQQTALASYAYNLGVAFQLRDDILDVIGDEQKLGKPIGSDVRNARPSIVSLLVSEKCNLSLQELATHCRNRFPPDDLRPAFKAGVRRAMTLCKGYVKKGRSYLYELPESTPRRSLEQLLWYAALREQ
jgi:geranylgeranyl diphosphate synthase, type I